MRILSWNINGIRAAVKKGFHEFLKKEKPDILCLQEIKINNTARLKENFDFPGYTEFWNSAERPGYSGTAILAREDLKLEYLGRLDSDNEGRVQVVELPGFYLANIYFPNANHELSRLKFKIDFSDKLLKYFKNLQKNKPLVITGDYNVAHQEIDLARPRENVGNPGFTDEEREWMTKFLRSGFIDTFRHFYPRKIQYSWWSFRQGARARNIGWRIDYICVSKKLIDKIKSAYIRDNIGGSDHCPVGINIEP